MATRKLTDAEIHERYTRLVAALNKMVDIEKRRRDVTKELRDELADVKGEMTILRREINAGEVEIDPQGRLI